MHSWPCFLNKFAFYIFVTLTSYLYLRLYLKLLQRCNATIVHVFPWYNYVPHKKDDKFVEFCWWELVLYKPFHDFCMDIQQKNDEIMQHWVNFNYISWHVNRDPLPRVETIHSREEKECNALPTQQSTKSVIF